MSEIGSIQEIEEGEIIIEADLQVGHKIGEGEDHIREIGKIGLNQEKLREKGRGQVNGILVGQAPHDIQ